MWRRRFRILRNPTLLFWLALLLCCAALTLAQSALQRQKWLAEATERDYQDRLDAVYRAVIPFCDRSMAQVAAGLNGGGPLIGQAGEEVRPFNTLAGTVLDDSRPIPPGVNPSAPASSFRAELPATVVDRRLQGWVIHLHFIDGELRGAYTITPPHAAYPGPPAGWVAMQIVLAGLAYAGAGIWCLSALLLPFNRPWRRQLAQAALAGLLVAALARALGPGWALPPLTLSGILHAPLLAGIMLAALLSAVMLIIPSRRARPMAGPPPCAHCGYDLTGNISGICPECGRYTPQGLIDRWRDEADRVASIESEESISDDSSEADIADEDESDAAPLDPEETDDERPPLLAAWVSAGGSESALTYQSLHQSEPTVQAPVGVPIG